MTYTRVTKKAMFVLPQERKAGKGFNCSLLLPEVKIQRQTFQKCANQDKRLQLKISAREIPVGQKKKVSIMRIVKNMNRIPGKDVKSPSLEIPKSLAEKDSGQPDLTWRRILD